MNRENKRKQFENGYYKTHACDDTFTCKVCGRLVIPAGASSDHRNHCPNCLSSQHLEIEPGDRKVRLRRNHGTRAVWVRRSGEWAVIHRSRRCVSFSSNPRRGGRQPEEADDHWMKPHSRTALSAVYIERFRSDGLERQHAKNCNHSKPAIASANSANAYHSSR